MVDDDVALVRNIIDTTRCKLSENCKVSRTMLQGTIISVAIYAIVKIGLAKRQKT